MDVTNEAAIFKPQEKDNQFSEHRNVHQEQNKGDTEKGIVYYEILNS